MNWTDDSSNTKLIDAFPHRNWIMVSQGPNISDPLDQVPIFLPADDAWLAARTLFSRLAVWYLRRYVRAICQGEK